jgi:hypothetical protein
LGCGGINSARLFGNLMTQRHVRFDAEYVFIRVARLQRVFRLNSGRFKTRVPKSSARRNARRFGPWREGSGT